MRVNGNGSYRVSFEVAGMMLGAGTFRTKREAISMARNICKTGQQIVEVAVKTKGGTNMYAPMNPVIETATVEKWTRDGNWYEWVPIMSTSYDMEHDFYFFAPERRASEHCRCG